MTATFKILTGKALSTAIGGMGKKAATYSESLWQVAASALHHVEGKGNGSVEYVNAVYSATPTNFRGGLKAWFEHMGRVKFDSDTGAFKFAKKRKFLEAEMMTVSPAEFAKPSGSKRPRDASPLEGMRDLVKRLQAAVDKAEDWSAEADGVDGDRFLSVVAALGGALKTAKAFATVMEQERDSAKEAEKQAAIEAALKAGSESGKAAEKAASEAADKAARGAPQGRKAAKRKATGGNAVRKPRVAKEKRILEPTEKKTAMAAAMEAAQGAPVH